MLDALKNGRGPSVYFFRITDVEVVLGTEWIIGGNIAATAQRIRNAGGLSMRQGLLDLSIAVSDAVADLHSQGILHGDLHPGNIIAEKSRRIRFIDFGLSRQVIDVDNQYGIPRGGIPFSCDPEFAAAQLAAKTARLTSAAEQYSLGAMLYTIWTGQYYLDWRLEKDEMLQQIINDPPLSFESRNVHSWPELEAVIAKALAKCPSERYQSVAELSGALKSLDSGASGGWHNITSEYSVKIDLFLETMLGRLAVTGSDFPTLNASIPTASLTYGAAGIAYALVTLARKRSDARLIAAADLWVQRAYSSSKKPEAFRNDALGFGPDIASESSLFHGLLGIHFVRTLASAVIGDRSAAVQSLDNFILCSRADCGELDLFLGKAGILLGLSELAECLSAVEGFECCDIYSRGNEVADELSAVFRTEGVATSKTIRALGVAHGWSGVAFALLRWARATGSTPNELLRDRLGELVRLGEPNGLGRHWPVYSGAKENSFVEGWCNGSAGHAMVFSLAYEIFNREEFAQAAIAAAEDAYASTTTLGTLCCGLAGTGYSCLAIHRITGDADWISRAEACAYRASKCTSDSFYRDSLYKGAVGVALLIQDLKETAFAAMPVFESSAY